jgi:hypothetical protein
MQKLYLCIAVRILGITAFNTAAKARVVDQIIITAPSEFVSAHFTFPTATTLDARRPEPAFNGAC